MSEPDTGIFNALNKGVRDAKGEWFYVLGCDDYIEYPNVMDGIIADIPPDVEIIVTPVRNGKNRYCFTSESELNRMYFQLAYCHQGVIMQTSVARDYGGFDERYVSCADFDMLLKAHFAERKFKYIFRPFAYFHVGGLSCQEESSKYVRQVVAKHFRITEKQAYQGHLPFNCVWPFVFHKDKAIRLSARHMMRNRISYWATPIKFFIKPLWLIAREKIVRNPCFIVDTGCKREVAK